MTSPVIRPARRSDVPAIVKLLADDPLGRTREAATSELANSYWRAFDALDSDPRNRLVVAELDGLVVGTLQLTYIPSLSFMGGERAHIEAVRVSTEHRGLGLGRAMVEWVIEQARIRGCRMVQLTTDKRRPDALHFYEALGFHASHEGMKLSL